MALTTATGQPSDSPRPDFKGASVPNRIGYRFTDLDPGSNIYVQKDDVLVFQWMTNRTGGDSINIGVRLLLPAREAGRTQPDTATIDNPLGDSPYGEILAIQQQFSTTVLNTVQTSTVALAEGYLMSVAALCTGASERGQTFVRAFLVRGSSSAANTTYVLFGDYPTIAASVGWPGGNQYSPLDGRGRLESILVGQPAAGADWSLSVPTQSRLRIQSIQARLVTSGVVANRNVQFRLLDVAQAFPFGQYPGNVAVPASTTAEVSGAPGITPNGLVTTDIQISLPNDLYLRNDGFTELRIQSLTVGIDAGDQWSRIMVNVERWLDF